MVREMQIKAHSTDPLHLEMRSFTNVTAILLISIYCVVDAGVPIGHLN